MSEPAVDYKDTVNLPRTDFPMRADLATREPAQLKAWSEQLVYARLLEALGDTGLVVALRPGRLARPRSGGTPRLAQNMRPG